MRNPYTFIALFFTTFILLACTSSIDKEKTVRDYSASSLLDKQWEWVETVTPVQTIQSTNPQNYTLKLSADGKAQLRVDCNRGGGTYEADNGKINFGQLFSTRMACSPDSLDSIFMRDLSRTTSFFIEGDNLYLEMPVDSGTMKFNKTKK